MWRIMMSSLEARKGEIEHQRLQTQRRRCLASSPGRLFQWWRLLSQLKQQRWMRVTLGKEVGYCMLEDREGLLEAASTDAG